ncbi:MAG TPA: PAS domain-containing protein [Steroidobacteraceae bacterium]|nr:PAS domain-containing protein [Steroidobacteraceae bacterium]
MRERLHPSTLQRPNRTPAEQRRLHERLQTAVWGAGLGIWEFDFRHGRTSWFGSWCEELDLYPCDGKDGAMRWDSRIHPEDLPRFSRHFDEHVSGRCEEFQAEYRICTRVGQWRWLFDRGRIIERAPDGAPLRMVGVCVDIDSRKEAELALLRSHEGLETALKSAEEECRGLECEIGRIACREQQRISHDLHDGLGQELTGIALILRGVLAQLRKEHSAACADIEGVIAHVSKAIESTRTLARGLSPLGAEGSCLVAALESLAARATAQYGVPVSFASSLNGSPALDEVVATHLYRIAQESLTNSLRHGGASEVRIEIASCGGRLILQIVDNGRGFCETPPGRSEGLGLKIMRHRAQTLGGELVLEPASAGGAIVRFSCPLAASRAAREPCAHPQQHVASGA